MQPTLKVLFSYHKDAVVPANIKENPLFLPVLIPQNKFFEAQLFTQDVVKGLNTDYVGHVAYSYLKKIPAYDFESLVGMNPNADVITLMTGQHDMYEFANMYHPGFMEVWDRLVRLLGYEPNPAPKPFYCNYWIMKKEIFEKYCVVAQRAMKFLDEDFVLKDLVNRDSGYKGTHECLPADKLMEICGKPYYTFHPFIIERLVCLFVDREKCKVKYLNRDEAMNIPMNTYTDAKDLYLTRSKKERTVLL